METTRGIVDALLNGRLRLVSREDDGSGGSVFGFEAAAVKLGKREHSVLLAAESGVANKLVAIEQSLACSTVSESLQTALGKLGFRSRTEFLKVMACLRTGLAEGRVRIVGSEQLCWVFLPVEAVPMDPCLTQAERQVVAGVLNGRSNAAIANARRTSSRTVANQLAAIYRKLGVSSRWELVVRLSGKSATLPRCVVTAA